MTAAELASLWEPLARATDSALRPGMPTWWLIRDGVPKRWGWVAAEPTPGTPRRPLFVPDEIAAALWRDAAVRWLLVQRKRMFLERSPQGRVSVGKLLGENASLMVIPMNEIGDDLDHALAAAVKAVLDARE